MLGDRWVLDLHWGEALGASAKDAKSEGGRFFFVELGKLDILFDVSRPSVGLATLLSCDTAALGHVWIIPVVAAAPAIDAGDGSKGCAVTGVLRTSNKAALGTLLLELGVKRTLDAHDGSLSVMDSRKMPVQT